MKYAHYDKETGKLIGYYDSAIHQTIPEPNIQITEEQWQEAIDNGYNYVDAKNKTLSYKDFRTEEEKLNDVKKNKINYLKQTRDKLVNEIIVTLEMGERLDGNELAQTRMSRAIQALPDDTTTLDWIDANNNTVQLTKPKFSEALVLAGQRQTEIYVKYNELRTKAENATTVEEVEAIKWED